jgi:chromatin remodeling complex protein RSC6
MAVKVAEKAKKSKPNAGFMKPLQPDAILAEIVGKSPIPRTEIVKKIWEYIKKHNLQNPKDKRVIIADDKLKPLFGGKKEVNMFQLTKLISEHVSNT